jgi:hypothetical protein
MMRTAVVLVATIVASVVTVPSPSVEAVSSEPQIDITAAGPLGPITVIGDSVLVGAAIEPSLPANLAAAGWGPIRFRAGLGYTAGNFQPAGSTFSAANWIGWWKQAGWDAPNVVVNLGNNDVGFCNSSLSCNANTIRYMMDAIGPGHTVWWSKITRLYTLQAEADAYNGALELVASERDNLRLWDWPAAQVAQALPLSWDFIHLRDPATYRRRSALMSADITAQLAIGVRTGGDAPLPGAAGAPAEYEPLTPVRVRDTRVAGGRVGAGAIAVFELGPLIPTGTTAVAVNLTAVTPSSAGFMTGFPCGSPAPRASNVNYGSGETRGALAVLPIGADGRLCVTTSATADMIVDLQGAFVDSASRLTPTAPQRLVDTRVSGRAATLTLPIPTGNVASITAVSLSLTATDPSRPGYLVAHPCGNVVPAVSNLNFEIGETIAGAAFVPVGAGDAVCITSNVWDTVDVIVDLTGVFSPSGALAFTPSAPTRTYDTRDGTGGWTPVHGRSQITDVRVAPPGAAAVTGTLTMVAPAGDGFLTAFGCGDPPTTSNVNAPRAGVLANAVTVGLAASGRLCIRASTATHVVFDTNGWWAP